MEFYFMNISLLCLKQHAIEQQLCFTHEFIADIAYFASPIKVS